MQTIVNKESTESDETKKLLEIISTMPKDLQNQMYWYARGLVDQGRTASNDNEKESA